MTDTSWLQAAKERAEAATEGPWWNESGDIHAPVGAREIHPLHALNEEDAEFAAHARTDLPLALELLAQAQQVLEFIEQVRENGPDALAENSYDIMLKVRDILCRIQKGDSE